MPNRILKETLLASRKLNEVSAEAERLYTRLLLVVDDFGRYVADADVLASKAFPRRRGADVDAEVSRCLSELSGAGLIEVYVVRSDRLIEVVNFQVHNKARADKSRFPSREEGQSFLGLASADKCSQVSASVDSGPPMRPLSSSLSLAPSLASALGELSSDESDQPALFAPKESAPPKADGKRDREAEVTRVLTHWRSIHATPASAIEGKAGEKRRARVRARLAEGTTADECILALDGALKDPWLMGTDPKSTKAYRDVDTILRDRLQIEKLIGLVLPAGPRPQIASGGNSGRPATAPVARPPEVLKPVEPVEPWSAASELVSCHFWTKVGGGAPRKFRLPANKTLPEGFQIPDEHLPIQAVEAVDR